MKKRLLRIALWCAGILVLIELLLRVVWGFGTPVLYVEDRDFEYIYSPNQDVKRFGNRIATNEYSMRSVPLSSADDVRILKLGDSVINGGSHTDQDSLASTLLEKRLQKEYGKRIRVLNVSAGSWGPDNAAAYLQKFGDFNCGMIILVFSSHDLYDCMEHEKVVDANYNYPGKRPLCAIAEVCNRYVLPRIEEWCGPETPVPSKLSPEMISTTPGNINPGWHFFIDYCRKKNIALYVFLHPTVQEIEQGSYNENGKKLVALLDSNQVKYTLELEQGAKADLYRDNIHYNDRGQRFLAGEEYPVIKTFLEEQYHAKGAH